MSSWEIIFLNSFLFMVLKRNKQKKKHFLPTYVSAIIYCFN